MPLGPLMKFSLDHMGRGIRVEDHVDTFSNHLDDHALQLNHRLTLHSID